MALIVRRLEQWALGPEGGPRWRRPHRGAYTRLHSSLISKGRATMNGRGLARDPPPADRPPQPATDEHPGRVTREDQRSYVKIEVMRGISAADIHDSLEEACGADAVQWSTVHSWVHGLFAGAHRGHHPPTAAGSGILARPRPPLPPPPPQGPLRDFGPASRWMEGPSPRGDTAKITSGATSAVEVGGVWLAAAAAAPGAERRAPRCPAAPRPPAPHRPAPGPARADAAPGPAALSAAAAPAAAAAAGPRLAGGGPGGGGAGGGGPGGGGPGRGGGGPGGGRRPRGGGGPCDRLRRGHGGRGGQEAAAPV